MTIVVALNLRKTLNRSYYILRKIKRKLKVSDYFAINVCIFYLLDYKIIFIVFRYYFICCVTSPKEKT